MFGSWDLILTEAESTFTEEMQVEEARLYSELRNEWRMRAWRE